MSGKSVSKDKTAGKEASKPMPATEPAKDQTTTVNDAGLKPDASAGQRQPSGPAEVLGDVVWLMSHSPAHKHLFIADLEWLVLPPLMLRQCSVLRQGGRPFAFISWATVSEEVESRISKGQLRMGPADWRSGENAWIIDMVAPFGGGDLALKEVHERIFSGRKIKVLQTELNSNGFFVHEVPNERR